MRVSVVVSLLIAVVAATPAMERKDADWWKRTVFYQIYPRSFLDTNGDGVGDLPGITKKLGHLKETGVGATWLSPIFKSPQVDQGYDISDFRDIHEEFGTMQDFDNLVAEAKKLGIRIILDFVPNHSSDKHEWFTKSVDRVAGYEDYYVWKDGQNDNKDPPNNWVSVFGGSAWEFNKKRNQWYLHAFAIQQPDLNYRNPKVVEEMKEVLRFWLKKGVDGFRCDAVPFLFEDPEFKDEPVDPATNTITKHPYTQNLPETLDMIYQWRDVVDEFSKDETKVMMTEAYADIKTQMLYYGDGKPNGKEGAHFTFNFLLITDLNKDSDAHDFVNTINRWFAYMPIQYTANWVLGNHDQHRFATRYGPESVDGLNMLEMMLPGVGVTYNGDEWGQEDGYVSWEDTKDPSAINAGKDHYLEVTRDPERTPLHWDDSFNAGFSTANKTWLPVSDKYKETNLAKQKAQKESHYSVYKDIVKLRDQKALVHGDINVKALSTTVIALTRELPNEPIFVFVFNRNDKPQVVDLGPFKNLPDTAKVVVHSVSSQFKKDDEVNTRKLELKPYEAYVLQAVSL